MKKTLLLIALPALMALSGCGNVAAQPKVEPKQPAIEFAEDTVAHEEIFGEAVAAEQPAIRKMDELDDESAYKIGYQIHFDNNETPADDSDDTISIRFIAALKTTYTSKVWSRGITTLAGVETRAFGNKKSDNSELASTVYYTSLSNGGSDVMRIGEGAFVGYTSFIVYSMTDIPYVANKDSYVGVSLKMDAVQTDFYAVKIETNAGHTASTDTFKLSSDKENYFLKGTFNNNPGILDENTSRRGTNRAAFSVSLKEDDSFVIINRGDDGSKFQYWNSSCLSYEGNSAVLIDFQNNSGEIQAKNEGDYVLYLNSEETAQLWRFKYGEYAGFYVRGTAAGGWDNPSNTYQFLKAPEEEEYHAYLLGVTLSKGDGDGLQFLIGNYDNYNDKWGWYGYRRNWFDNYSWQDTVTGDASANFTAGDSSYGDVGNIKCTVTGVYDLYLQDDGHVKINTHVAA